MLIRKEKRREEFRDKGDIRIVRHGKIEGEVSSLGLHNWLMYSKARDNICIMTELFFSRRHSEQWRFELTRYLPQQSGFPPSKKRLSYQMSEMFTFCAGR